MIALHDMNLSWEIPAGFTFVGIEAQGSYLIPTFMRHENGKTSIVKVYLESQGREVSRTVEEILDPVVPAAKPEPEPISKKFRFWNGMNLVLLGLEEIASCLKMW